MSTNIIIAGRQIGPGQPPYIIAEMSGNHNGDINRAFTLIEAAKNAGADAVKLQTYTADTLTIDHDSPDFQITGGLWDGKSLYELYEQAHTPWDWHERLFAKGAELGITVFSSPFDHTSVDFLETLNAPAYKIASFEAIDLDLVKKVAATGKPLIISTGMSNECEISETVHTARNAGGQNLILLHCISSYPAQPADMNLLTVPDMAARFDVPTGLSDHTLGTSVSVAGVALGACVIEKHFTLARADGGPDAAFSLEPDELRELVDSCRDIHGALGTATYERSESERSNMVFRRSLYVVEAMRAGDEFSRTNLRSIRPGYGLAPKHLTAILGQKAACDIPRGTPMSIGLVAEEQ